LELRYFSDLQIAGEELAFLKEVNDRHPVLQAISDHRLGPYYMPVRAPRKVGYTFFESLVSPANARKAADYFDVVAAGSTWCAGKLREKGLDRVATVIQGIDPLSFNPCFARKELFGERFVIFSGGKFEFRKGQDVVIRAYKVLQDKYPDVLLVNSWYNHWRSVETNMANSRLIQFREHRGDHVSRINAVLQDNGIDLSRVVTLPACNNESLARRIRTRTSACFPIAARGAPTWC
jgi:glycosyltransferase involved in cell wall biosynthesis